MSTSAIAVSTLAAPLSSALAGDCEASKETKLNEDETKVRADFHRPSVRHAAQAPACPLQHPGHSQRIMFKVGYDA
ncbi:hypothetical protein [Pleomorphomonas sp. T1.2MG-36]|uniref:hypothetical protein n=1 Tax=Pleomorphomonas sp. T1.2MG-36 TaxID=3041167 RepID=UPI00253F9B65|nr:hypothetical protein [Pleomorphomonas sp. T1.2MG-36]